MRRIFAVASALGLALATWVFIVSFHGATMNTLGALTWLLHLGIFALFVPFIFIERSVFKERNAFWSEFRLLAPKWATNTIKVVGALAIVCFVWFLIRSQAAAPDVVNRQFVLNQHGHIIRALSKDEYFELKALELRLFASGWMIFYAILAAFWTFLKQPNRANRTL